MSSLKKIHFSIRPFHRQTDVPRLLALRSAIEAVDQVGLNTGEQALQVEFNWNGHDPDQDRWVVEAVNLPDQFLGHAWVYQQTAVRSVIHVAVHPAYRRLGIGAELLKTAINRAQETGAAQIVAGAEDHDVIAANFLRNRGFLPVGHNRHLIAPADFPIDHPTWPAGFKVRSYAELQELSFVVAACNACYADMWGHGENTQRSTVESYSRLMEKYPNHFFPEGMFVLFSAEDEIAGICFGRIEQLGNEKPQKVIDSPGVVPAFRHLQLQRPLLQTTMLWLNSMAQGEFHLFSWGDSAETAALYRDCGFTQTKEHTIEYLLNNQSG